jgi:hypothetical protein
VLVTSNKRLVYSITKYETQTFVRTGILHVAAPAIFLSVATFGELREPVNLEIRQIRMVQAVAATGLKVRTKEKCRARLRKGLGSYYGSPVEL